MYSCLGLEVMSGDDSIDPGQWLLDVTDADAASHQGGGAALQELPAAVVLLPLVEFLQHLHLLGESGLGFRELAGESKIKKSPTGCN